MKIKTTVRVIVLVVLISVFWLSEAAGGSFERRWIYVSETSAVIYWQLGDISASAWSYVEYGKTENLVSSTEQTKKARWSQLHRLRDLDAGATYYYRMVTVDSFTGAIETSEILSFTLESKSDAIRIPGDLSGPPYELDQPDKAYILTKDITTDGDGIRILAEGITLDLDGHTLTFGNNTAEQVFGVRFQAQGEGTLCNGHIVQGERSGDYSCAVRSNSRPYPTEIYGIATDVYLKCAYPINFHSQAQGVNIHHNHLYSRVIDLESRHYPGNAILRMYMAGGDVHIYDNLLTEGCHWGMMLRNESFNVEVNNNDIQHHCQYVNGYAIGPSPGAEVHHNKVTSTGRGAHLTGDGIVFHDNYFNIKAHQHLSDLPANTRPFYHRLIEVHGIKFEGDGATNCKVYNNYVRMVQKLESDSLGLGEPENKIDNGVYFRGTAASISSTSLVDDIGNWEVDRWRYYFVKYDPALPPVQIYSNTTNSLSASYEAASPGEYTVYMKWQYVPPTPLNIACYSPNAMNEVYGNTFIALTEQTNIWHGEYGNTGNWASTIMFVSMDNGAASSGMYSIYVHDNEFISNDLFLNSYEDVNMTVRIESNNFTLVDRPHVTDRESRFRQIGSALENSVNSGGNTFDLSPSQQGMDFNGDGKNSVSDAIQMILLGRRDQSNLNLDWDVDGGFSVKDVFAFIRSIINKVQNYSLTSLAYLSGIQLSSDDKSVYTPEELAEMNKKGMDGL